MDPSGRIRQVPKLVARMLLTLVFIDMLKCRIYGIYCVLSHDYF
jgi:hypothetical protein